MKRLLLLLAAITTMASAQNLGKTDAQIIAMGIDKWQDFYTKKQGYSTADMCQANDVYGQAVKRRNNRLLQDQLDGDFKLKIEKLRSLLNTYGSTSIDIAYTRTGGGTMWNPVYAAVLAEGEETIYKILSDTAKPSRHRVVSDVTKQIDLAQQAVDKPAKNPGAEDWMRPKEAYPALKLLRKTYIEIAAIAKTMSRKDSDHLLNFCLSYARTASE